MTEAEGFAAVPNWMIRDERFDIYDIAVFAALASHTGPGGVRPSQATLAREARCSERQVRIVLARLVEAGLVEVTRRRRSGAGAGRHGALTNGYVLHPHGRFAADEESAGDAGTSEEPAHDDDEPAPGDRPTGTTAQVVPLTEEEPVKEEPGEEARTPTPDVVRLCALLAELVRANGHRVGVVGATWWQACDRLMRLDGLTAEQVEILARWATSDEFWAVNVRSMPALRKHLDQIRAQRNRQLAKRANVSTIDHGRTVDALLAERERAAEGERLGVTA